MLAPTIAVSEIAMSLTQELEAIAAGAASRIPPNFLERMAKATADLRAAGIERRALGVNDIAPDFTLADARGGQVTLSARRRMGPVVLVFYRGAWCPYCNAELRAYQRLLPDFAAAGASLMAVSPQLPDGSLSMAERNALTFDVLSDVGLEAAEAFGIVFTLPPELREVYAALGLDLPRVNGDESWRLPVPATFVVGRDGIIDLAGVEVDYRQRLAPELALEAVRLMHAEGELV